MPPASGPIRVKVKKRKPTVVKPPAGDVASSGGDYGTQEGCADGQARAQGDPVRQTQVKDVKSNRDLGRAKTYHKAHPEILQPAQEEEGRLLGTALNGRHHRHRPGPVVRRGDLRQGAGHQDPPRRQEGRQERPADAADLAVSTPTSWRSSRSTVVHRPREGPGDARSRPTRSWRSIRASSSPRSPSARC
jgi:hypothetical protein